MRSLATNLFIFSLLPSAWGQPPIINPDAVVNSASFAAPIAPGALATIFGTNLSVETATAQVLPLPKTLGGVRLQIGGREAALLYVSPTQINFQVPAPPEYGPESLSLVGFGNVPLILSGPRGPSVPVQVFVAREAPGIFVKGGGNCGVGAILNTTPEGVVTENSPAVSAEPGGWISIFSTGSGESYFAPPDGAAAPGTEPLARYKWGSLVVIGAGLKTYFSPRTTYDGLAPGFVGLGQTIVQLPQDAPEDCEVPLYLASIRRNSQPVTVSVKRGGGPCTPSELVRLASLKWIKSATTGPRLTDISSAESFEAQFAHGGRSWLDHPRLPVLGYTNVGNPTTGPGCGGYAGANSQAGELSLDTGRGTTIVGPVRTPSNEFLYRQNLPAGSVVPGKLSVVATGSSELGAFRSEIAIPNPIRVKTNLAPSTIIDRNRAFRVEWDGGDADMIVNIQVVSISDPIDSYYHGVQQFVRGDSGSVVFPLQAIAGGILQFPVQPFRGAMVIIRVLPLTPTTFEANGLTLGGRHQWEYLFEYKGLTIGTPPTAPPAAQ